jgi:hypothetical protein
MKAIRDGERIETRNKILGKDRKEKKEGRGKERKEKKNRRQ